MIKRTIAIILILPLAAFCANYINVIYPKENQIIAPVDSSFIFGNANPAARLFINGAPIKIHPEGGFIAYLPLTKGNFTFKMLSVLSGDTAKTSLNIMVGHLPIKSDTPILKFSLNPSARTVLMAEDEFEISIKARKGGQPYCRFRDDSDWTPMFPASDSLREESVFGAMPLSPDTFEFIPYSSFLPMKGAGDSSKVYFLYLSPSDPCLNQPQQLNPTDSSDYYVVKLTQSSGKIVTLIERPRIIRMAPGKGYKLVNQPAGIKLQYAGEVPEYYRVKLAKNIFGYVKRIEAELSQYGIAKPRGEVSFITADNLTRNIEISMKVGEMLPFELREEGDLLSVDIFGVTPNVDWIRQNNIEKYVKSIWWTQPQEGVFRLYIRWSEERFWGYSGRYEKDKFILQIKKKPVVGGLRKGPLAGLKIMLDPGHSKDSGAVGPTGLAEKDANLWIAKELRNILTGKGATVLMTRTGNEDVPLYNRPDTAIKENVDILISIHNNALPDGVNPFTNNGTSAYYYFPQSRPLAEAIHKHLLAQTKLPDNGLYYGNLALTRVSNFPAVLVECAFMMIPEQESLLRKASFRHKIAQGICDGVVEFLK